MELKAFKIKDVETQKFSTGTCKPNWTSRGKTWGSTHAIKLHLRQFCEHYTTGYDDKGNYKFLKGWWNNIPENWEVVELSTEGLKTYSAKELYPLITGVNERTKII